MDFREFLKNNIVALKELNNGIGNTMNTNDINEITNVEKQCHSKMAIIH